MDKPLALALYGLLDPAHLPPNEPYATTDAALVARAEVAVRAGVTLIQVRDKRPSARDQIRLARALKETLAATAVPLLINDRVDVALAAGADGVHLGQSDMAPRDARRLLGSDRLIGLTVHTTDEADEAPVDCLDYVSIGGVFATRSKTNAHPPIGLEGLSDILASIRARSSQMPVCAIAGITADRVSDVFAAGVNGVAVLSPLMAQGDPSAAIAAMRQAVEDALGPRRGDRVS